MRVSRLPPATLRWGEENWCMFLWVNLRLVRPAWSWQWGHSIEKASPRERAPVASSWWLGMGHRVADWPGMGG